MLVSSGNLEEEMRAETVKLGQALLDHHRATTTRLPPHTVRRIIPSQYTIQYSKLCEQAGVPHVLRMVGSFLGEVAEWCAARGYPPINSLAVNGTTGLPGDGYDGAGGFHIVNWPANVEQCIRFPGYPVAFP